MAPAKKGNLRGSRGPPRAGPQRPPGRARPAPKRAATQRRNIRGRLPNGHHFDAFGQKPPQSLPFSIGPATHLAGFAAATASVSPSGAADLMLLYQPNSSAPYGSFLYDHATGNWTSTFQRLPGVAIDGTISSGNPADFMCSRGSIRIRNITRAADAGGLVRVLNFTSSTDPSNDGNPSLSSIRTNIESNPRTTTFSGSTLSASRQWDNIPVNSARYLHFNKSSDHTGHSSSFWLAMNDPGMSTTCILFKGFSTPQTYDVTYAATYWARYIDAGPLASMAQLPQTIPLPVSNMIRDAAERVGTAGRNVLSDAANQGKHAFVKGLMNQGLRYSATSGRFQEL
jgi:hypothetical protein